MASRLNPYISLPGTAAEALEFYREVFGGSVDIMRFGQHGMAGPDADLVMHGQIETDAGYTLMVSDSPSFMDPPPPASSISVSLSGDDADALRGYWERLSGSGTVSTPLEKQMWGDEFGQCTDRFGVAWLVNIAGSAT